MIDSLEKIIRNINNTKYGKYIFNIKDTGELLKLSITTFRNLLKDKKALDGKILL